jgi:hypothetical protein
MSNVCADGKTTNLLANSSIPHQIERNMFLQAHKDFMITFWHVFDVYFDVSSSPWSCLFIELWLSTLQLVSRSSRPMSKATPYHSISYRNLEFFTSSKNRSICDMLALSTICVHLCILPNLLDVTLFQDHCHVAL